MPLWTFFLLPLGFVAIWLATGFFLAHFSGWNSLAETYPDRPIAAHKRLDWVSAVIRRQGRRGLRFQKSLAMEAGPDGMRIKPPRFLMPFASAVTVPGAEIEAAESGKLIYPMVLNIGRDQDWQIGLRRGSCDAIMSALKSAA
ncbi:hypothetical protein [Aurantiacibacter sediminis]|uniref:Uncharacterized protein n=1 Tax=Aurantiacibacter sediminis TaxID=2793064 RepID=A0ABS0N4L3_9SPHN|nr:hypothetical protein [Aurantiacibacter sediminis]MBH5322376.1 hypothetical protein [Aurantiacibacter sediminis]